MGIGLVLVLGTVFFWDHLLTQFTRGQTDSGVGDVTTGRTDLWAEGIRFIRLHYLTGNFGVQFKVSFFNGPVHLHNSFLEVYATHGACSLILMLYIFRSITMRVLPFLMAIWFYSCFQYGIFWNFSPMDAVMYFFLAQGFQRSSQPNGSPSLEHPP
jgi:O-antigen ligase